MALLNTTDRCMKWGLKMFPVEVKDEFKKTCKERNVKMLDAIRGAVRNYVNETEELYKDKSIKNIPKNKVSIETGKNWLVRNFPSKLHADFKSCCACRGDKMMDATIYVVKNYIKEK